MTVKHMETRAYHSNMKKFEEVLSDLAVVQGVDPRLYDRCTAIARRWIQDAREVGYLSMREYCLRGYCLYTLCPKGYNLLHVESGIFVEAYGVLKQAEDALRREVSKWYWGNKNPE
jgi:hypothetical protein